jgi:long-chain fatty acid transport protein
MKANARATALAVFLGILLPCAGSLGAGFAIQEQAASATGRACAVTAVADSPSAVFYNPAGLAFQPGLGIEAGLTLIVPLASHRDPGSGETTDAEPDLFYPPSVYVSYLLPENIAVGLGFFVPYGLGIAWPEDWSGFQEVRSIDLQTFVINPTMAWSPLPWLAVGAGFGFVRSVVELERGIEFVDETGSLRAGGGAWGFGANAGLLLRFFKGRLGFGLNYRSDVRLDFKGRADFTVPEPFAALLEDQAVRTTLRLPHTLALGVSGKPVEMLTLSLDLTVTAWSSFEEFGLTFPGDEGKPEDEKLSQSEARNWRNVYTVRLGAEVAPPPVPWLMLRLGLAYDKTPSPSNTLSPTLPDADRILVSAGAGFSLPKGFRVDVAYMFVYFFERSSTGDAFPATYNASAHLVGLSLGYRFTGLGW